MYKLLYLMALPLAVLCKSPTTDHLPRQCYRKGDPGRCLAYIPSWEYNPATKTCQQFIYGGCGGYVPFKSLEECRRDCRVPAGSNKPKACYRKGETGPCRAVIPSWQYNTKSGKCEEFTYGGCKGYVPFKTENRCRAECEGEKPNPLPKVCKRRGETGPCRASIRAWEYDEASGQCRSFVYGGCKGYVPFRAKEQCQNTCIAK
ncbi:hypothetical protein K493DRAFT_318868 [Basidiobolus meristosporus CBS 931.73]|uniref:BPTI/Kunitz inhibitor domain-containing protein n=1 Tax=Basidiobolus meristosporus CBS 931.73 TaxID=1314790 RepID=A0A1Y1XU63_9FUNG|nr:hypothetical protein K493DRAFT_318868 [Basidiobolus meristosporus CBS 931.73]|eukprot:ORX89225.1 hypothetical protein K493DRAFT_318868 [Basidiobolus meristosporus CBS 931.73]